MASYASELHCIAAYVPRLPLPFSAKSSLESHRVVRIALFSRDMLAAQRACRPLRLAILRTNHFHTSTVVAAQGSPTGPDLKANIYNLPALRAMDFTDKELRELGEDDPDATSGGHLRLQQQRRILYYWRLIEHEMPNLVGMSSTWC